MVGGQESARSTLHLAELFRLADQGRPPRQSRTGDAADEDGAGLARHRSLMRDFSRDHRWLSLNTATVRKQGDLARDHRGLRAARHPRHRSLARPGGGRRARSRRARGARCRARALRLLPRRHVHLRRVARAARCATTTAARRRGEGARRALHRARRRRPAAIFAAGQRGRRRTSRRRAAQVEDALAEMLDYAKQANMPLAIEPLHPAYAADRACVNTTKQALDICDRLDPDRSGMLGVALDVYHIWWDSELMGADRARRQGSPARVPRLRLAGADQGHPQRPRHDGRRRHRHQIACARRSRRKALPAIRRSRSSPMTGGAGRWTRCCAPASNGTRRWCSSHERCLTGCELLQRVEARLRGAARRGITRRPGRLRPTRRLSWP